MPRFRSMSQVFGDPGWAYAQTVGLGDYQGAHCTMISECTDETGFPNPHPLYLTHRVNLRWTVSGLRPGYWLMDKFQVSMGALDPLPWSPDNPPPSDNVALSMGLSRSNPNKPVVDLPVFLFELKDIPEMLRDWGHELLRKAPKSGGRNLAKIPRSAAKRYVEYQFGIAPFISDIGRMLDFQSQVDKKMKRLESLSSGHSSSRVSVWSDTVSSEVYEDYVTSAYQESRRVFNRLETVREKWTSTTWKATIPLPQTDHDKRILACRLAYGLDISLSTLWEAMPWSWLIDWFSNAGDLFTASRNTIPVTHGGSCIMTTTTLRRAIDGYALAPSGATCTVTPPPFNFQIKERSVMGDADPLLEFNVPFLDVKQSSILGALAVLKLR